MFDSPFPFTKVTHQKKSLGGDSYIEHVYTFRNKDNKRYLVFVEQYDWNVFAVKFCTHERKNFTDRFNALSKRNECNRVLSTVGAVMREVIDKNPYASFGFIGSTLPGEAKNNTKRYRLYSRVVEQVISPVLFEHRKSANNSTYLMLNKDNMAQQPDLLVKIEAMFNSLYLIDQ